MSGVQIWNLKTSQIEEEKVYGDFFVSLLYGNPFGFQIADKFLAGKSLSRWYGALQDSGWSKKKITPFVQNFSIPMEEYENREFCSFNDFFTRKFRVGARSFPREKSLMGAFAEARYFAYEKSSQLQSIPVKGLNLKPKQLLDELPEAGRFHGGPILLARLCPVDYHRFHFPDSGKFKSILSASGKLHSVNPLALHRDPELFLHNERMISVLETKSFGLLAYVEVGALCVGKIVQSKKPGETFERGEEKGLFLFGGSTVIVMGEPGRWIPLPILLNQTALGRETLVQLGSAVAKTKPKEV